eukprot:COSAG01_NODE_5774_length_4040_cov_16.478051_2_plen_217_part_00
MQGDYGACQLIQPKASKTEVKHKRLVMQANLAWEIGRTEMNWSGARVKHMKSGKAQMKFTLKNAMTGKFLHDTGDDDGRCELDDNDDSANACWIFRPHDPLADEFQAETTQFVIENYHTGRILHPAAAEVVDSEEDKEVCADALELVTVLENERDRLAPEPKRQRVDPPASPMPGANVAAAPAAAAAAAPNNLPAATADSTGGAAVGAFSGMDKGL